MANQKKPIIRKTEPAAQAPGKVEPKEEVVVDPTLQAAHVIDRNFRRSMAKVTGAVDYPAFMHSFLDAIVHLMWSPGTQFRHWLDCMTFMRKIAAIEAGLLQMKDEKRFRDPDWKEWPYSMYQSLFLCVEDFIQTRFTDISGVAKHSELLNRFYIGQITAMLNPMNFPIMNPEVVRTTMEEKGENLVRGFQNLMENMKSYDGEVVIRHSRDDYYVVGKTVAATPGKVVFRNRHVELLQFAPATKKVHGTPILMVPAWINKYYILDLQPHNSIAKYLVEQGFTVYVTSWKNIADISYKDDGLAVYTSEGVMESIKAIREITGCESVHLMGYCMGAILCACAIAHLRAQGDTSVKTLSFLAAQLDFSDSGDLQSLIDESQISFLETLMEEKGYLEKSSLMQTYSLLRPRSLFWDYWVDDFILGKDPHNLDFLFWNDDGTRMPARLHKDILERLYLEDQLTEGKFIMGDGSSLDLRNIDMDLYSVGTMNDHIAPWKNVYRIPHFVTSPIKFILASSGHVAGIVNPPADKKGYFFTDGTLGKGPDNWKATATRYEGSWWTDWAAWLKERSAPELDKLPWPPKKEYDLGPAPGTYVFEK